MNLKRTWTIGVNRCAGLLLAIGSWAVYASDARADEDGVSFWVPGAYGSFAAVPVVPGWSLINTYYHSTASIAGAETWEDVAYETVAYTFETPVLGGQASIGVTGSFGRTATSLASSVAGAIAGPSGGSLSFSQSPTLQQAVWAFGDLYLQATLRWNLGVHNLMAYVTGGVPVGYYERLSLASLGIGHGAIDAGGAYTYYDPSTGREFSATLGFTYNLQNPYTLYQNGIDMHLELGASQALNKHLFAGAVGYLYKEIGCDIGAAPALGCFQSQVMGAGPQLGLWFPVAGKQGFLNLKGYMEFAAENRPSGFNIWITFSISSAARDKP